MHRAPKRARARGGARGATARRGGGRRRHRRSARFGVRGHGGQLRGRHRARTCAGVAQLAGGGEVARPGGRRRGRRRDARAREAYARKRHGLGLRVRRDFVARRFASSTERERRRDGFDGGLREAASWFSGGSVFVPRGGPVLGRRRRGGGDAVRKRRALASGRASRRAVPGGPRVAGGARRGDFRAARRVGDARRQRRRLFERRSSFFAERSFVRARDDGDVLDSRTGNRRERLPFGVGVRRRRRR